MKKAFYVILMLILLSACSTTQIQPDFQLSEALDQDQPATLYDLTFEEIQTFDSLWLALETNERYVLIKIKHGMTRDKALYTFMDETQRLGGDKFLVFEDPSYRGGVQALAILKR